MLTPRSEGEMEGKAANFSSLSPPSTTLKKIFGGMSELATRYCSQSVVVMDGMLLLLKNSNLSRERERGGEWPLLDSS